jgi:hypothetical protein
MSAVQKVFKTASVLACVVLALLVGGQSALASNDHPISFGANYASSDGGWVEACDMEFDNNGVYAEVVLANGSMDRVGDHNGAKGGCGKYSYTISVVRIRVCEDHSGCSVWWGKLGW